MIWDTFSDSLRAYLWQEQEALELQAVDDGIARYRKYRSNAEPCHLGPEKQLIFDALGTLTPAIEKLQSELKQRKTKPGRHQFWWDVVLEIPADKLGFICINRAVMCSANPATNNVTNVCMELRKAVDNYLAVEKIKTHNKSLWEEQRVRWKNLTNTALRHIKKKVNADLPKWAPNQAAIFGRYMLELIVRSTRTVEIVPIYRGPRKSLELRLLPEVRDAIEKQHGNMELVASTVGIPCVVPPLDWTSEDLGGYHYYTKDRLTLDRMGMHDVVRDPQKLSSTLEAVNHLQSAAWRINKEVTREADALWTHGGDIGGIPGTTKKLPPFPEDGDDETKSEWKAEAKAIHDFNHQTEARRISFALALATAKKYRKYPAQWFVHNLDFRGRGYNVSRHLKPQAHDSVKGLLEFAEGKRLGDEGLFWLRVNTANHFGVDKVSLDDRVDWVIQELEPRTRSGIDLVEDGAWAKADKPIQALASLLELQKALASGDPQSFISHLPVGVDGTCNGLQHLSAAGRDEVGGRLVNLLPSDVPCDAYKVVAGRVRELLPGLASTPEETLLAHLWVGLINRSHVKRAIMTTPYGVTSQGVVTQLISDGHIDDLGTDDIMPRWKAARFLQLAIDQAKGIEMSAATLIMNWLRDIATIANQANKPVKWTTPMGFEVCQMYLETKQTVVRTPFQRLTIRLVDDGDIRINQNKQYRGLPPNWVHSLDACHMMGTALRMKDRGKTMSTVHDEFSTHACDVPELQTCLRQEFAEMHSRDLLTEFKVEVEKQLEVELPAPPARGSLDIAQIMNSTYFFS